MKKLMLSVLLLSSVIILSKTSEVFDYIKPGKYEVGLKIIETQDETRLFPVSESQNENPRPVKMYIWYPAKAMYSDCKLSVKCYLKFLAEDMKINEGAFEQTVDSLKMNYNLFNRIDNKYLQLLSLKETDAILNALPLDGSYPVVIVGQGNKYGSAISNFILCENLASNGYIVISFPPVGTNSLKPKNNLEDIETQVQDLNFILREAVALPNADNEKIALIGFDMCSFSSFLLQMRNNSIDAMVCLSNENTYVKCSELIKNVPGYGPETLFIPMLHFMNEEVNHTSMDLDETLSVIQTSDNVDRYLVRLKNYPNSAYSSFCLLGIIDEEYNPAEVKTNYKNICDYTLNFLNSYLNDDERSRKYLMRETDKTEKLSGTIRIKYLPAKEM